MAKKKLLLVDDSGTTLMIEKMALGKQYDYVIAKDGEDAIAKAVDERPDLILLDIVMPKMDGFEACKRLRRLEETRDTPVIMVTTRGEPQNVELGYELGCNDYITKPINSHELAAKVRDLLQSSEAPPLAGCAVQSSDPRLGGSTPELDSGSQVPGPKATSEVSR